MPVYLRYLVGSLHFPCMWTVELYSQDQWGWCDLEDRGRLLLGVDERWTPWKFDNGRRNIILVTVRHSLTKLTQQNARSCLVEKKLLSSAMFH